MAISKKHRLDEPIKIILDKQKFYSALPYNTKGDLFESCVIDDPADEEMKRLVEMAEVTYEEKNDDDTYIVAVCLNTQEECRDFLEWGIENGFFNSIEDLEAATPGFIAACGEDPDDYNLPARIMYPMDDDPSNDPDGDGDDEGTVEEEPITDDEEEPVNTDESVTMRFSRCRKLYESDDDDKDDGNGDDNDDGDGNGDDNGDDNGDSNDDNDDKDNDDDEEEQALTAIALTVKTEDVDAFKKELTDAGIDEDDITVEEHEGEIKEADENGEGNDNGDNGDDNGDNGDDNGDGGDEGKSEYSDVIVKMDEENYDIIEKLCKKKGIDLESELDGKVDKGDEGDGDGKKDDDGDGTGDVDEIPDFDTDFFNDDSFGEDDEQ